MGWAYSTMAPSTTWAKHNIIQYNKNICIAHGDRPFDSYLRCGQSPGRQRWLCIAIVGAEKLKECRLKLVVHEGIHTRFWLAERRQRDVWYMCRRFLMYGGRLVNRLLYVKRAILYWIHLCTGSQWRCDTLIRVASCLLDSDNGTTSKYSGLDICRRLTRLSISVFVSAMHHYVVSVMFSWLKKQKCS